MLYETHSRVNDVNWPTWNGNAVSWLLLSELWQRVSRRANLRLCPLIQHSQFSQ